MEPSPLESDSFELPESVDAEESTEEFDFPILEPPPVEDHIPAIINVIEDPRNYVEFRPLTVMLPPKDPSNMLHPVFLHILPPEPPKKRQKTNYEEPTHQKKPTCKAKRIGTKRFAKTILWWKSKNPSKEFHVQISEIYANRALKQVGT